MLILFNTGKEKDSMTNSPNSKVMGRLDRLHTSIFPVNKMNLKAIRETNPEQPMVQVVTHSLFLSMCMVPLDLGFIRPNIHQLGKRNLKIYELEEMTSRGNYFGRTSSNFPS